MLAHIHMLINKEYLAILKEYDKLIISLKSVLRVYRKNKNPPKVLVEEIIE